MGRVGSWHSQESLTKVRNGRRRHSAGAGLQSDRHPARRRPERRVPRARTGRSAPPRVLWEIGADGCDVRDAARPARPRLRLPQPAAALAGGDGLVTVGAGARRPAGADRAAHRRRARRAGPARPPERRARRRRCSTPLSDRQRERLVAAMGEVERLLTAALVQLDAVDPADAGARSASAPYFAELDRRFDAGFDPRRASPPADELRPPAGLSCVATPARRAVGCGALKFHAASRPRSSACGWRRPPRARGRPAPAQRARGRARASGAPLVRLETNKSAHRGHRLYRSAGYREVAAVQRRALRPPLVREAPHVGHALCRALGQQRRIASRSAAVTDSAYLSLTATWRAT